MRFGCLNRPTGNLRGLQLSWISCLIAIMGLAVQVAPLYAADAFEELRVRIERLEEENRTLRADINSPASTSTSEERLPPSPGSAFFADPNDRQESASEGTDEEQRLNGLIEKYMRQRPVEQAGVDAEAGQLSALETKVAGVLDRLNKKTYPTIQMNGAFQADTGYFIQDPNSVIS